MPPVWLLDVFAALMLVTAAVSGARLVSVRPARRAQPARSWAVADPTAPRLRPRRAVRADEDIANLLMGIAMAGMLAPAVTTLAPSSWEAIFGALTAWFGWRAACGSRVNGIRSLTSGHCAMHLLHCGAMVYLFAAAVTASGGMEMTGMGSPVPSLEYPTLALAFASVLAGYTAWDIGRLSVLRRRVAAASSGAAVGDTAPTAAAAALAGRIAMGVTMAFMLLIMI